GPGGNVVPGPIRPARVLAPHLLLPGEVHRRRHHAGVESSHAGVHAVHRRPTVGVVLAVGRPVVRAPPVRGRAPLVPDGAPDPRGAGDVLVPAQRRALATGRHVRRTRAVAAGG